MLRAASTTFIEPCLPSPADKPPSGSNCFHEIKHDGFRLMARRDPVGIRLITRRGNDGTNRYPLVAEAVNYLKVRFCLIDGEVVATRREWLPFSCSSDRIASECHIVGGHFLERPGGRFRMRDAARLQPVDRTIGR
jgi:ATP-dependent DNA ligase